MAYLVIRLLGREVDGLVESFTVPLKLHSLSPVVECARDKDLGGGMRPDETVSYRSASRQLIAVKGANEPGEGMTSHVGALDQLRSKGSDRGDAKKARG